MSLLLTALASIVGSTGSIFANATSNGTVNNVLKNVGSQMAQKGIEEGVKKLTGSNKK